LGTIPERETEIAAFFGIGERVSVHGGLEVNVMGRSERMPTIYIPHGGGPWNVMQESFATGTGYTALKAYLEGLGTEFKGTIKSILVASAHKELEVVYSCAGASGAGVEMIAKIGASDFCVGRVIRPKNCEILHA
jgi:hypothetical protein